MRRGAAPDGDDAEGERTARRSLRSDAVPAGAADLASAPNPWSGLRLIVRSIRAERRPALVAIGAGLAWTAAMVSTPLLVEAGLDRGLQAGSVHLGQVTLWALVVVGVGLFQGSCSAVRRYQAFSMAYRVETNLRQRLFAHLQRLHMAFHDQAQTGQLMSRAASDLQQVSNISVNVPITLSSVLILLIILGILVAMSPLLALVALWFLPVTVLVASIYTKRVTPPSLRLQQELGEMATIAEEAVVGVRAVKGFGAARALTDRARGQAARIRDEAVGLARMRSNFAPIQASLQALASVGVLAFGGHAVAAHRIPFGALAATLLYLNLMTTPLNLIMYTISLLPRSAASAGRVDQILALAPVIVDSPNAAPMPRPGSGEPGGERRGVELRFEGVRFTYPGRSDPVLDGFDLVVEAGASVALVGATGSGKTTIVRLIPRFYDVDEGRLVVDGVDVRSVRLASLRHDVGIVFEDTFLFTNSVRANIAFAEPDASMEQVIAAAHLAGADDFITGLPDGYDTVLGERGQSLSGGQRQRIALARAILGDPRILVLDDATSAVDPAKEHEIVEAMGAVMADRTTLIVAHRVATIQLAHRVVFLQGGRVAASGPHKELVERSADYRRVLATLEEVPAG